MSKEAKKKVVAPAKEKEPKKKNPLLDDEDTSKEEESADESTDEESTDEASDESTEEAAPAPKKGKVAAKDKSAEAKAPAKVDIAAAAASDIRSTKEILDAEEKVHFMVPLYEGEKAGAVHDCFINGYKYSVKKGVMVTVPRSIANLLANHYKVNAEVGSDMRLDQNDAKQDALA